MIDSEVVSQLGELVSNLGQWALFAYLYINEKRAHEVTRERYYDDLRSIAGMGAFRPMEQPGQPLP